jgi:RNA polymerase sigma-B factor
MALATTVSGAAGTQDPARHAAERELFARYARDRSPAARDAIFDRFLPLARKLAGRYRTVEALDDLEQVAALTLVRAIDRFDPERGLAFSSFAFPTILGELKRHLRDRGWSVHVPRALQERATKIERLSKELAGELGRSATVAELAQRSGNTTEEVLEALQAGTARHAVSLDAPARNAEDPDARGIQIAVEDVGFAFVEDAAMLDGLLRALPVRERQVLQLRFRDDLTQSEIGEITGISQMQVSRVIRSALTQIQASANPPGPSA